MTDAQQMREAAARESYENGSMLAESIDWSDLQPLNLTHELTIKKHRAIADAVARVVLEAAAEASEVVEDSLTDAPKRREGVRETFEAGYIAGWCEALESVRAAIRTLAPPETPALIQPSILERDAQARSDAAAIRRLRRLRRAYRRRIPDVNAEVESADGR